MIFLGGVILILFLPIRLKKGMTSQTYDRATLYEEFVRIPYELVLN